MVLYAYGTYAGLRFAEDEKNKKSLIIFYWLQVPWISSPIISYRFTAGFHASGSLIGNELSGFFRLGSDWNFSLLQPVQWGIGVNFFALVMVIVLINRKRHAKHSSD
jgi:hypothetical protein